MGFRLISRTQIKKIFMLEFTQENTMDFYHRSLHFPQIALKVNNISTMSHWHLAIGWQMKFAEKMISAHQ